MSKQSEPARGDRERKAPLRRVSNLLRDRRGAAALEFAFAAPVLFLFIIGIAQLGILFFANSGLKSAVGEGARYATIYPKPPNTAVAERITSRRFGLDPAYLTAPTIANCPTGGRPCIEIQMSYSAPIDFLFFQTPPVTLVERRRVFVQDCVPAPPPGTACP